MRSAILLLAALISGCSGQNSANAIDQNVVNNVVVNAPDVPENQVFTVEAPAVVNTAVGNRVSNAAPPADPLANESFVASGNEPFWSISVDTKRAKLVTPDDQKGVWFPVQRSVNNKSVTITGAMNGKPVKLTIEQEPCQDDMSGAKYPFKVELIATLNELPGRWLGCARRLTDPVPQPE